MSSQIPQSGRIDTADHCDPTWHIHEVANDFKVLSQPIPGCEEISLRDRLSTELRESADEVDDNTSDFQVVYQTEAESVLELSNSTVNAAIHLAWVATENSHYVGQMGIYVKNRGRLGRI